MIQISKILCPIDFSDFSRDALDHAVALATWYRAELTVMHVFAIPQVSAAEEDSADLIVMGVRGRGALDRLLFGSTTDHVIRQANCPVLTIRK